MFLVRVLILWIVASLGQGIAFKPKYAALVLNAETGDVLFDQASDEVRYPASLTKMMTLYLLFKALKDHKITMETTFRASKFATRQMPSKLGLRVGESISVRHIIMGLITKSANDAAVVAAEGLSGSVQQFVMHMNKTAQKLGMTNTHFRNPSGVPDPNQITTARDMARLASALMQDFPGFYTLFRTQAFSYRGAMHHNHNHLLGRVEGVDGIKTGYTAMSGFNLVSSAKRGEDRIIAVVLGCHNRIWRDQHMKRLIEASFSKLQAGSNDDFDQIQNIVQRLEWQPASTIDHIVARSHKRKKHRKRARPVTLNTAPAA